MRVQVSVRNLLQWLCIDSRRKECSGSLEVVIIMPNGVGRVARRRGVKPSGIAELPIAGLSTLQRFGSRDERRSGCRLGIIMLSGQSVDGALVGEGWRRHGLGGAGLVGGLKAAQRRLC